MTSAGSELQQVAGVYLAAVESGKHPTKAVQEAFGYERYTAVRRVSGAREAGLLPRTRRGEKLRRNPKVLRVAKELGIDYDRLIEAIREHAGGDIRL